MGICCTRNELTNDEVFSSPDNQENSDTLFDPSKVPELAYESNIYDRNTVNDNLQSLITNINKIFLSYIKKINFVELFNISLFYQEDYTNSKFLLYDLRPRSEQQENFLKKMKRINYTYEEIKRMQIDLSKNFKRFINHKTIILILGNSQERNTSILTLFTELETEISINILNTNLSIKSLSPSTLKLYNFLEEKDYGILPFIAFTFTHLTNIKKEGYAFISFRDLNKMNFSFGTIFGLIKGNQKTLEQSSTNKFLSRFYNSMSITTIIHLDQEEDSSISERPSISSNSVLSYKEYQIPNTIFDVRQKKPNFNEMCNTIRSEMEKGHSFHFDVLRGPNPNCKNDWVSIIILLLWKITRCDFQKIIGYAETKWVFVDGIKDIVTKNLDNINLLYNEYNIHNDCE